MKKVVVEGEVYTLLDRDEVTYGPKPASKYNEMKGNYEKSIRAQIRLADENERLEYELQNVEDILQAVTRERNILCMVAKRWEARVENISSRETLTEKLNKMSDKREALQEVVDELRAQKECERTRVHKLTIERDAGRRVIKQYMETLSELEEKEKRLRPPPEDELWVYCHEHNEVKKTRISGTLFSRALLKMKKGGKK
jgi:chromosome segregation ATPase